MSRPETIAYWKEIIDSYDKEKETVLEYCKRLGICNRMYYHYRKEIYGRTKAYRPRSGEKKLLPVLVESPKEIHIQVNHVDLNYQSDSLSDQELSRIIRLCRDL